MTETCAWCNAKFDKRAVRLKKRIRCPNCGVSTIDPWPTPEQLDEAYGGWYRPKSGRFGRFGDRFFSWLRGRLSKRLDTIAPPGAILDVGAGDGSLVDALRRQGREASGLDRYASRPDFLKIDIEEAEGDWSGIVFWHSLEHMPAPTKALQHASELLVPNGVLVVAVPNATSLQAKIFGDRWFHLDYPRHFVHIPSRALMTRLESLGLQVERVSYVRGGQILFGWIHGIVGSISPDLDFYDAIRERNARNRPLSSGRRVLILGLGLIISPIAAIGALAEILARKSGTVYVEARLSEGAVGG